MSHVRQMWCTKAKYFQPAKICCLFPSVKNKAGWTLCCGFIAQSSCQCDKNITPLIVARFHLEENPLLMQLWSNQRLQDGQWSNFPKLKQLGLLMVPSLAPYQLRFQLAHLKHSYRPSCWPDVQLAVKLRQRVYQRYAKKQVLAG